MGLLFKIAWRNILRHKTKSLVIGVILFLGALLMTVGNGVLSGMDQGLRNNIINGFIGDMVVVSENQKTDNILFGLYGKSIEAVYNYLSIKEVIQDEPYIDRFLPAGKNMAMALNEDGDPGFMYLLGVDFSKYQKMFPDNLTCTEGRLLDQNEKGVLVPVFARKELYNYCNIWLNPENEPVVEEHLSPEARENISALNVKSDVVFLGYNNDNTTNDIRLTVKGIIRYHALNTFWGHFVIMDIESYRECLGYFSASDKTVTLSKEKQQLLSMDDKKLDSVFGEAAMFFDNTVSEPVLKLSVSDSRQKQPVDIEAGTYNMVFVKLKKGVALDEAVQKLNVVLKEKKLGARVIPWTKASGIIGSMAVLIKGFLFGFVMFLFFIAIMIIVNTLSMAAMERVQEIGMMRAVGAQKSFIRNMFIGETVFLSALFGGAGIVLGIAVIFILPGLHITTQNDMLQLLYGGDTFQPVFNEVDLLLTLFQLVLVTGLAVVYPVRVAGSITPLDAVSRD